VQPALDHLQIPRSSFLWLGKACTLAGGVTLLIAAAVMVVEMRRER
jgi:H+/Cl- antiporter ClcA